MACGKPKIKHSMNISNILADNGSLTMSVDILFNNEDQDEYEKFLKNVDQIKFAFDLMFKAYKSDEILNKGISNNTMKKIL